MTHPRVLLADDHRMFAAGLKTLLADDFELVGVVEDGRAMVEAAARLRPDVIVADISMPGLNGIEALRQIRKKDTSVKVVFLTMHRDALYARRAIEAGAMGFVLKHSAPDELVAAIRAAVAGRRFVTSELDGDALRSIEGDSPDRAADPLASLTPRQREVLQLLAEGKSAKEIADILSISTRTVEFHKYQMMESIGIQNSVELVHFAIRHGISDL
jgi:DNA-binding NarL/FixJ family response regulator